MTDMPNTDELIEEFARRVAVKCRPAMRVAIGDSTPKQYDRADRMAAAIAEAVRETFKEKPGIAPPAPSPEMIEEARRAAQEKADELGIGIEQVVAVGSPAGVIAIALPEVEIDDE